MTTDSKYKVLLLGSGGRENAIAWKFSQSSMLDSLYCFPGNPGMEAFGECILGKVSDFGKIRDIIVEKKIDLVVAGPEDPLVGGLKNFLLEDPDTSEVLFVGPDREGARLEGSKDFAKEFMCRHGIPTAVHRTFSASEIEDAAMFLKGLKPPYVLKADGLAAGKGVLIIDDYDEAVSELKQMFSGKFGSAGSKVVIEQFLSGIECSVFIIDDGEHYMILPVAKDYKRIKDGDEGLNTGGMGSVSPVPFADDAFMKKVEERIIIPTVKGLKDDGIDYRGFIFIGLMNCDGEPFVIEYNVRMGDPETEAVMPRIESDLLSHLVAAASGNLSKEKLKISDSTSVAVISVSGGYPLSYEKGFAVNGTEKLEGVILFHSGTARDADGRLVTAGGRVLATVCVGKDLFSARRKVYDEISKIEFDGEFHRQDIGLDVAKYL
ncbi:MAG: phosphoribosylamine--glycine ligase [Alistipes sp.]|nr:phosphoribosylamine--glycine ligase [Candidatus Minthomonas equi]